MPLPKEVNMYHDVRVVLEAARGAGGARLELDNPGAAKHWRQRAYYYRKLLARSDQAAHAKIIGYMAQTEWDDMHLTCEGNVVVIRFGTFKGTLKGLDGKPVKVAPVVPKASRVNPLPPAPSDDPLLAEALQLVGDRDED